MNKLKDGIMTKDTKTAKLTRYEIDRNKKISKVFLIFIICTTGSPLFFNQLN
ncbi:MAG: hypothetical protein HOJ48_20045 [Desulfobacula sp.]|nr:hypothetical protein [Desulfobacula sp.]